MNRSQTAIAAALLAFASAATAAASTIVPPQPSALQPVDVRMTVDSCTYTAGTVHVTASGTTLRLTQYLRACFAAGTPQVVDVRLGAFPAGDYRLEIYASVEATGTPSETVAFTVKPGLDLTLLDPPLNRPLTDYTGIWWDPSKPGFGLALHQNPVNYGLFGAWYVYDGQGQATWFTLQGGQWISETKWSGKVYKTTLAAGALATIELGGSAELDFTNLPRDGSGRFTFNLPANAGTWSISRFPL